MRSSGKNYVNLGSKVIAAGATAVVLATAAAIVTNYLISGSSRRAELRESMRSTIQQAEVVMHDMEALHSSGAFATERLESAARAGGSSGLRGSVFYRAIPVVAAWNSVKGVAKDRGFDFLTPSRPDLTPRNPANSGAEFAAAFRAFAGGKDEYFTEESGMLILVRPVRMTAGCLECHGDASTSPTHDGRDLLGFPMENLHQGDIKGAFVLRTPISQDKVVLASTGTMTAVGVVVLLLVAGVFAWWSRRHIVGPLDRCSADLASGASSIRQAVEKVAGASLRLSTDASDQAAALEQSAASAEQVNAMTRTIAERSRAAAALMGNASQQVTRTNRTLGEMGVSMDGIGESSRKISNINRVIEEIAFQTNILALNAAVEAARAGEAGLGFAVVADEVRNLAQRASQAARDTATLIDESIQRSQGGADKLKEVAQDLTGLTTTASDVRVQMDGVSAGNEEQAQGISQIAQAVNHMQQLTMQVAGAAEANADAGHSLSEESQRMEAVVARLRQLMAGGG
jgi:methyl-accepting chemotaxis protein